MEELFKLMEQSGALDDPARYREDVRKREEQGTTGIGEGIAIPHAKSKAVRRPALCAMTVPSGVDFDALDGAPARLLFLIAAPDNAADGHLEVLARLSVLLMNETVREELLRAAAPEEFLGVLDREERRREPDAQGEPGNAEEETERSIASQKKTAQEEIPGKSNAANPEKPATDGQSGRKNAPHRRSGEEEATQNRSGKDGFYDVLAVTACPTGIAHTYMAAESLQKAAEALGISLKVETNGSGGAKNVLTDEEIRAARGVIVAADRDVEMERFWGKPVLQTPVSEGIRNPEKLLRRAAAGDAPVYGKGGGREAPLKKTGENADEKTGGGRMVYRNLMNGVSHMLPFVIGGGILIALAFLFDDASLDPANFGSNTPFAALLKQIGDSAFGFMLPVLSGYIALSIADRPGLAPGFVGGFLAGAGGSGFLGALLAGFLAGYAVRLLKKLFGFLPDALEGIKPVLLYPLLGTFAVGAILVLLVNPPVSALNRAVSSGLSAMGETSRALSGILLGAMMSIDMGGPVNKAAYVFATASLVDGAGSAVASPFMAAVMAGGMVPPLAIALCATFFPSRFPKKERQSALTNYIMGASFITEGAIPFAAADPLRVIPACAVGAAAAGGLSMAFGCTLRAPHGGLFVLSVVEHPWKYLGAVIAGALVGALLLAALKRPAREEL